MSPGGEGNKNCFRFDCGRSTLCDGNWSALVTAGLRVCTDSSANSRIRVPLPDEQAPNNDLRGSCCRRAGGSPQNLRVLRHKLQPHTLNRDFTPSFCPQRKIDDNRIRMEPPVRKVTSYLFISLDGVVEAPDKFVRSDLYEDFDPLIAETIAEQDAVLLGRKTYDEWSAYWPSSTIEPFASFINNTPKYVVSKTLKSVDWPKSNLIAGNLGDEIAALKRRPGKAIGVHGSISLVQSLLTAGLLDELRLTLVPAAAGHGRHLLSRDGEPIQLTLDSTRATTRGLQYMIFRPLR